MSDGTLIITGLGIGLAVAAPVGPVNIMTIHRAVQGGFLAGLAPGLGALVADVLFAMVAALGITAISGFIEGYSIALQALGGVIVLAMGYTIIRRRGTSANNPRAVPDDTALSRLGAAMSGFALTITNPAAMFGFLAIFSSLGEIGADPGDFHAALVLVAGVLAGSLMWWIALSATVSRFRARVTDGVMAQINLASGALLVVFGIGVLAYVALQLNG